MILFSIQDKWLIRNTNIWLKIIYIEVKWLTRLMTLNIWRICPNSKINFTLTYISIGSSRFLFPREFCFSQTDWLWMLNDDSKRSITHKLLAYTRMILMIFKNTSGAQPRTNYPCQFGKFKVYDMCWSRKKNVRTLWCLKNSGWWNFEATNVNLILSDKLKSGSIFQLYNYNIWIISNCHQSVWYGIFQRP